VLGDAVLPGWTLKRERLVVDVIMNMVAAGLMPAPRLEKLNLVGLGVMPPDISSWFMAMPAPLPTPLPLRLSRASLEGAALEHVLEEPLPTWRAIPSPRWVPSLPGIDLDKGRNFGTVALIELLVLSQSALTQHKHLSPSWTATAPAAAPGVHVGAVGPRR
jgi:hypothetical protein